MTWKRRCTSENRMVGRLSINWLMPGMRIVRIMNEGRD